MSTRELCKLCGRISSVGFSVPDDVWEAVRSAAGQRNVLCLSCFTGIADELGLRWCREIEFWPVSLAAHRDEA